MFHSISFWPDATTSCDSSLTSPSIERPDGDGRFAVAVESGGDAQMGASFIGIAAQDPEAVDPDRPGVEAPHGPPQPAGIGRDVGDWKTPVMLRRPVVDVCGEQVTSTART